MPRPRFPENAFDAVRSELMLMHVPDVQQALSEMVRRTAGRTYAGQDFDWESDAASSPLPRSWNDRRLRESDL
jgi:hypothetical protein